MSRRVTHTAHSSDESSLFKNTDSIDEETDGSSLTLAQINSPKCNIKDSDVDDGTDMAGSSLMLPALVQTKDDGGNVRVRSNVKTRDDSNALDDFFNHPDIKEKIAALGQSNFIAYNVSSHNSFPPHHKHHKR